MGNKFSQETSTHTVIEEKEKEEIKKSDVLQAVYSPPVIPENKEKERRDSVPPVIKKVINVNVKRNSLPPSSKLPNPVNLSPPPFIPISPIPLPSHSISPPPSHSISPTLSHPVSHPTSPTSSQESHEASQESNGYHGKKKATIPKPLRRAVWEKHYGKDLSHGPCDICGHDLSVFEYECGHIHAEALGGETTVENLLPICGACNKSMGKMNLYQFKEKIHLVALTQEEKEIVSHLTPEELSQASHGSQNTNGNNKKGGTAQQCTGMTKKGVRCTRKTNNSNGLCVKHCP